MKINDSYVARRRFLCGMLGGGAAALGTGVGLPLVAYVGNLQEAPLPEWLELEAADYQLAPGTSKIITYGRIPALLIQTPGPQSELKIFKAVCTHFDCTVGYKPEENCIFCACHDGYYDLDGRVVSGPPPRPLDEFCKRVRDDGTLVIALEKDNLEKAFQDP
jgi:nitrite reductase/ring-hydroxylating ferredoxin subunit